MGGCRHPTPDVLETGDAAPEDTEDDAILACVFPDDAPRPGLLVVFRVFLDESGTQADKPVVSIGCVVLRPDRVRSLSRWWRRTLREASIAEFKAADCTEGTGEFADWPQDDRDAFRTKFAAKLDKSAVYAMAISVVRKDFEAVVYPFASVGSDFRDPYLWAMRGCLEGIAKSPHRKDHRLACVFDEGYGRWPQAYDHFKRVRKLQQLEHIFFETFTVAPSINVPCIQAADLIAYELRQYSFSAARRGAL